MKNLRNLAQKLCKVLMIALATQVGVSKAEAHAPIAFTLSSHGSSLFLAHHASLFSPPHGFKTLNIKVTSNVYSQFPGLKLSGATRTWLTNVHQSIFANFNIGKTLGQQIFTGGNITGGVLSGTLYANFSGNTYTRVGPVIDAIGNNPNNTGNFFHLFSGSSANTLNFTGSVGTLPQGAFKVTQILGVHLTGSQSAYFSQYANAGRGGLNAGILKGPSLTNLAGGEITGLSYGRLFGNTFIRSTNTLLAFGNDSLNTASGPSSITLSSNPASFFTYPSGVMKTITAGQQSFTLYHSIFGSPFFSSGAFIKSIGTDSLITTHPFFFHSTFPAQSYFALVGTKFHF